MLYDSGIICEFWSNTWKPVFWPIFGDFYCLRWFLYCLRRFLGVKITPKYSKMDRKIVIYAKNAIRYVKFGQMTENRIFGPFFRTLRVLWDHQNQLLGTPKRLQNHVWAQLLLLNSSIAYLWQLDQVWSHLEQERPRNHRKPLFLIFAKCSNGPFWAHQNRLFSHLIEHKCS